MYGCVGSGFKAHDLLIDYSLEIAGECGRSLRCQKTGSDICRILACVISLIGSPDVLPLFARSTYCSRDNPGVSKEVEIGDK